MWWASSTNMLTRKFLQYSCIIHVIIPYINRIRYCSYKYECFQTTMLLVNYAIYGTFYSKILYSPWNITAQPDFNQNLNHLFQRTQPTLWCLLGKMFNWKKNINFYFPSVFLPFKTESMSKHENACISISDLWSSMANSAILAMSSPRTPWSWALWYVVPLGSVIMSTVTFNLNARTKILNNSWNLDWWTLPWLPYSAPA